MAQLITVRLNKADHQPLGFRLQGGKDFGTPLVVQKVNGGSAAERAGLQAGDALIRVNTTDVYSLRHQEAQDAIRAAGINLELTVQRSLQQEMENAKYNPIPTCLTVSGGGTWRPTITPTGSLPRPGSRPIGGSPALVTNTSLKATPQPSRAFGSGHNNVAKPFGYMNGNDAVKSIVNKQYNTPVNMYSDKTIAETLSAQTEVLAGGVLGVNFKKNEKTYDAEKSAVFKVLQEEQNDPEPVEVPHQGGTPTATTPVSGLRHVQAPVTRPDAPINNTGGLPPGQNICEECERLITGVFVRIKDKNLHVECFKCSTCGTSLKNQGYYNLNGKLYCDIHAKLVARQNPPAPNLDPVTVPPGNRIPTNTYSTPLPPLATNNYTNGSSSLFSPSSNLSGPKPFGSSIGSAYSPSLSPRSAPLSPARPVTAPVAAAPIAPAPIAAPQPPAPFVPTNESLTTSSPHKTEFKSPAEERLIRKMAKMALNGYEIGIQRKIKPADHIQSMADKIQDTVVTKHPLNTDNLQSTENIPSKTLDKFKVHENILSAGDKIKDILKNGPIVTESLPKPNLLIPPPLPSSPVPTFNIHSISIGHSPNSNGDNKKYDNGIKNLNTNFVPDERTIHGADKTYNGSGYSSSEDSYKDKVEQNYTGTLRKSGLDKSSFLSSMNNTNGSNVNRDLNFDGNLCNTLNKKKLFEPSDAISNTSLTNGFKQNDKTNEISETKTQNKTTVIDQASQITMSDNIKTAPIVQDEEPMKLNNLHNNSLYTFKTANNDRKLNIQEQINNITDNANTNETKDISDMNGKQQNKDEEVVVRRRQKRNPRDDDGRRDSHIIARPLSTIQCADVADGLYPVCHKCDRAITRGPFITALGRIWCPEHFICVNATCRRPLQDIGFVEENGQLYCEFCFEQYIAPACDKCHAKIKGIGMTCSQQSVSLAASRWKQATGGSRRSTITTTVSASTARSAKRTSRDKVSSPREVDHFVRRTPAKSPQQLMYNSDTVYSTTTFRPVSPSPITPPLNTPSPQRTRKLETPLHFDGGLFSDIRSTDGKLLSKVTVDRVQSSTRHDITDSPSMNVDINSKENKYVDDIIKTETITNKEFVTVKFTPVPLELDTPRMLTPSEMYDIQQKNFTPVEYIKDNFEDLESYKIVSSVCKEKLFENNLMLPEISLTDSLLDKPNMSEPVKKGSSPLANLLISEQLTKIDNYIQESLEVCTGVRNSFTPSPVFIENDIKTAPIINDNNISQKEEQIVQKVIHAEQSHNIHRTHHEIMEEKVDYLSETLADKTSSNDIFTKDRKEEVRNNESIKQSPTLYHEGNKDMPKINSVNEKHPGVLRAIYKMPIHYHAAIMCFLLIIYNLVYQYIKQNCYGKKNN